MIPFLFFFFSSLPRSVTFARISLFQFLRQVSLLSTAIGAKTLCRSEFAFFCNPLPLWLPQH